MRVSFLLVVNVGGQRTAQEGDILSAALLTGY
jgi:hypothetical protein